MSLPYRLGVGTLLLNPHGHVFVGQRIDMRSEAWQMPQGGIDEGEDPKVAALRELEEETGVSAGQVEVIAESRDWLTYDLPDHLIPQLWNGQYRGQKQKWYALRFLGNDADINLQTAHPEFFAWRWVPMPLLPELIVPFKREIYEQVVAEFSFLLPQFRQYPPLNG